ncbi:MAG TPA: PQQ-binding-like beta-propeller repeat protein [Fimbriimonadaceae bacterium]|nr:PQQ-binding-like beta-propeller repeat protein [Fimbriimonadaceae bacterium]HRJ97177.1 PQQ-binding-like beta-propeller repeat protein [Fimbriimonadaceae bacterium]
MTVPIDPAILPELPGSGGLVDHLVFSPDGEVLISSDVHSVVTAWCDGVPLWKLDLSRRFGFPRRGGQVRSLAFSKGGEALYVATPGRVLAVDAASGQIRWSKELPRTWCFLVVRPNGLAVRPSGHIVCSLENGYFVVWDDAGREMAKWYDNDAPRYFGLLSDGVHLLGVDRFTLALWHLDRREKLTTSESAEAIHAFGMARGVPTVATRSLDAIEVWDMQSATRILRVGIKTGRPLLAIAPHSPILIFAEEGRLHLMDFEGRRIGVILTDAVCLAFRDQGDDLAIGLADGRILLCRLGLSERERPALS